jgi:hypothetical protein
MSNCHVTELCKVYTALFEDAKYAYPTLEVEFERDLVRLLDAVVQRGIHAFCVDLPAIGKHLDRCLDNGEYKVSGLPLTKRVSGTVPIPKFLRGLYLLVFDRNGCLKEIPDVQAIFFLRQILYGAKKTLLDSSDAAKAREIEDFAALDAGLPEPEAFWSSRSLGSDARPCETYGGFHTSNGLAVTPGARGAFREEDHEASSLLRNLDLVSSFLCSALGPYRPEEWDFRHGPGAISETTGPTNKYCWSNWSEALETVFPIADYGFHNYGSWVRGIRAGEVIGSSDPSSRLICVPKTYEKPRLIAAEPSEHQFCQQNIWHYFRSRTRDSWIGDFVRFTDQSQNQDLCLKGSRDGSLCTIDLSSASDRVTPHVVAQLFRSNTSILFALRATRTRFVSQNINPKVDKLIALRKFSTMGSAATFPVESFIFLACALSAVATSAKAKITRRWIKRQVGKVTVFGDDIIVPRESRELLVRLLEALYFKVNTGKSFWTGKFRESCGVDAYAGHDVTPAYWRAPNKGTPQSIAATLDTSNNFYKKFLIRTSNVIASTIEGIRFPLVNVDSGAVGLHSFCNPEILHKKRFNDELQREEVLVPVFKDRSRRTPTNCETALLQYFTEDPSPYDKWVHGVMQRPQVKLRLGWVSVHSLMKGTR